MSVRTTVGVIAVAMAAILGAAGCGGSDEPAATTTTESADAVTIADFAYAPETITVPAGSKVTWANSDDADHTATAEDGSFDTGTLHKGDDAAVVLDKPGTYAYYCRFHAFMKATVEVQ